MDNLAALVAADADSGGLLLRLLDPASAPTAGKGRAAGSAGPAAAVTVFIRDWDASACSSRKDHFEAVGLQAGRKATLSELASELRKGGWLRAVLGGTAAAADQAAAAAAVEESPARVVELLGHRRQAVRRLAAGAASAALCGAGGGCCSRAADGLARAALAALAAAGGEVLHEEQAEVLAGLVAIGRRAAAPGAPATAAAPWADWLAGVAAAAASGMARQALLRVRVAGDFVSDSNASTDWECAGLSACVALAAAEAHPAALVAACRAGFVEAAAALAIAGSSVPIHCSRSAQLVIAGVGTGMGSRGAAAQTAAAAGLEAVSALLCIAISVPPPPSGPLDQTSRANVCAAITTAAGAAGGEASGALQAAGECAAASAAAEAALTGPVLRHAADAGGGMWSACYTAVLQVTANLLPSTPPPPTTLPLPPTICLFSACLSKHALLHYLTSNLTSRYVRVCT